MIHPATELRLVDPDTGQGVFATAAIPRGTVVWVHDELDQILTPARVAALPEVLRAHVDRYAYVNADGDRVLCWDHGRYMNHSCAPTTTSIGTLLEIARRDLQPGDELTCEYGRAHVLEDFACRCGAPGCRGSLSTPDQPALWRRWDGEAAEAFAWALTVPQPVLAAARAVGAGAPIIAAIRERRPIALPSWADGVPGGA